MDTVREIEQEPTWIVHETGEPTTLYDFSSGLEGWSSKYGSTTLKYADKLPVSGLDVYDADGSTVSSSTLQGFAAISGGWGVPATLLSTLGVSNISELFRVPGGMPNASDKAAGIHHVAAVENTMELASGELTFNYVLKYSSGATHIDNATCKDPGSEAGFVILLDKDGNIVFKTELFGEATDNMGYAKGVCTITVPADGEYTLIIGTLDRNYWSTNSASNVPTLYVDEIVHQPADVVAGFTSQGNLVLGGLEGLESASVLEAAAVVSVVINGQEYLVPASGELELQNVYSQGDKLTINAEGAYTYITENAGGETNFDITYTLRETGSDDTATGVAHIRSDEYVMAGTDGNDTLNHASSTDDLIISGGLGDDILIGGAGDDILYGGAGNDTLFGGAGDDVLHGGAGNDMLYGGDGDDMLYGGTGNDVLFGGAGDDILIGGAGDDILIGGLGNDTMTGGDGSDIFVWNKEDFDNGTDIIVDFTLREDFLRLEGLFDTSESVSLDSILEHMNSGTLGLTVNDAGSLEVKVSDGLNNQTIEVQLDNTYLSSEAVATMQGDGASAEAEKAALLQMMLTIG